MPKIKGRDDGPDGRHEHYDVGGRSNVPRRNVVAEIKRGEHLGFHVLKVNGRESARDNPTTRQPTTSPATSPALYPTVLQLGRE